MSTLAIGDASTLPLARRDLKIVATEYRGRSYWTIKDPVALRYYQLRDEEHFILRLLDGRLSLDEIVASFEQRFSPRRLKRSELAGFLTMLHREGLVAAPAAGQGEQLLVRAAARERYSWPSVLANVLALRLPGVNPDRFLSWLAPKLAWLFSPLTLVTALVVFATALCIVTVRFGDLVGQLPGLGDFLGPGNLFWLAVSLIIVKSLHELGHAVACKHFGGQCHQMGIMLLVFTPALYCDVSDAWMFPDRWRRMAVSAAGMAVELVLATLATVVWSVSQPGWLHAMCLNVMFVCSVSTLLINGNPLLRYDGYYLLADWLGTPNLQPQASASVRRLLARLLAGIELETQDYLAKPGFVLLWSYAFASTIYRCVVLVGILWFLHSILHSHGVASLTPLIGILIMASLASDPVVQTISFLKSPAQRRRFRPWRLVASTLAVLAMVTLVASIPLPMRLTGPALTRPAGSRDVYVTKAGVLTFVKGVGQRVEAGETLAQLDNRQVELEVADLTGREAQQRLHVEHLALRQHRRPELADELPAAQQRLDGLTRQLEDKRRERERLSLSAPVAGVVLPPPRRDAAPTDEELSAFQGIPQDAANLGCFLSEGTLLCTIGDPQRLEALVAVDERDVQLLHPGQQVRLVLKHLPGEIWHGKVESISQRGQELPPSIVAERMVPLQPAADGRLAPISTWYQATVSLEPRGDVPLVGAVGWARIVVEPQPLWIRGYRAVRGTFRTPW